MLARSFKWKQSSVVRLNAMKCLSQFPRARMYSNKSTPSGSESKPPNRGKILILLGALAAGSTIASMVYQKDAPSEFVEPREISKEKKPAFSEDEVSVIFVLGGPGAGKGTQCANLVKDYGFAHLSAGDLLRAEQNREGSEFGALIKHYIKEGLIVPQEVTIALLKKAIQQNYENGIRRFLVDGFPRKMDQALTFEKEIVPSKFTLFFDCPEKVMLKRLLDRGKTSGRADDNAESIKKRFRTFVNTSMPVVEYFEQQDKVVKVSCDHSVELVYDHVKKAIDERIVN
ncbi:LAMI_0F03312g1_1 [Lachancea mirantina]|uniref:Uridylate kinase n=1 Tax=Lachancea mirantina TaxID=1230905 RepID=A0A1G4JX62_9SACH|nr:LAMI_0F03312g1_1 [Lachancea mirantina]